MSEQKSKSTIPKSTVNAVTSRTTTSDAMQSRRRMVQNYLVIWVDGKIDENTADCRNTLAQLRAAVSEVNVCTTLEGCVEFLNTMDEGKAFVISSGALGQSLVNDIHGMPQVDAIYIFCGNKARHEPWAKDWPKIRVVFTSIKPICVRNLLQKKEIPEAEINDLKRKYHQKSPVWWYTCEIFLFGMLNCGLRSLDMEAMSKLGFFIRSLHLQLKELHQEQLADFRKPFTVYRGQG
ncbi:unnamed protein product, partial [Rotaria magnacalcarata]